MGKRTRRRGKLDRRDRAHVAHDVPSRARRAELLNCFCWKKPPRFRRGYSEEMDAQQRTLGWPHQWFGFWSIDPTDSSAPSVHDFVDKSWNPHDKERIITYLTEAPTVLSGGGELDRCLLCESDELSDYFQSDDKWLWPEDLAHYVASHGVVLPARFVEHIRAHDYLPPTGFAHFCIRSIE